MFALRRHGQRGAEAAAEARLRSALIRSCRYSPSVGIPHKGRPPVSTAAAQTASSGPMLGWLAPILRKSCLRFLPRVGSAASVPARKKRPRFRSAARSQTGKHRAETGGPPEAGSPSPAGRRRDKPASPAPVLPRLHIGPRRVQTLHFGAYLTYLHKELHSALRAGTCTPFRLICFTFREANRSDGSLFGYSVLIILPLFTVCVK